MNIVKTIRQAFQFTRVRYFVQQKDPRINADYLDSKETKIPNICSNPENINEEGEYCKVTIQGKEVKSQEKLRIKAKLKNCKEINGVIAYI
ncbi:unnamed protein product [Paramecium primaurelia]|uniref:Uncharacterized protein n=1 Tax=Paramecium primaurelia TaxID=5886 RepID=A0A8S1JRA2_PARPR|nr:unnamed protein product [Paramecium primaurelia]